MKKINEAVAGVFIVIGLLAFLYIHRVLKIHLWSGEWQFNVLKYYKTYFINFTSTDWVLYLLITVVVVFLTLRSTKKT